MEFFLPILKFLWEFVKTWWWAFLPFLFYRRFIYMWLWWRGEVWDSVRPYIVLEIKVPPEVPRPFKAMENVFAALWQMYDPPNPREKWLDGQYQLKFSIELISKEGEVHFYLRIPKAFRKAAESAFFSQYPAVELAEVEDYTKTLPQDMPGKDWNMWGTDFRLANSDIYPIKTYPMFFEEMMAKEEEQRIDPMSLLIESFSRLDKGEHIWFQILLKPVAESEYPFVAKGREEVNRLVKRPKKASAPTLIGDFASVGKQLVTGITADTQEAPAQMLPPEMMLTPGERETVGFIEKKIAKLSFLTTIRIMYLAPKDVYFGASKTLILNHFLQFSTAVNYLRPLSETSTKVYTMPYFFLDKRRTYLRKRKLFRNYVYRLASCFPNEKMYLLNIEELATIFHLPGKITSSAVVQTIPSKRGEAPPGLPM